MVRMEVSKIPKFRKLTKSERILIAQWKNNGYSNKKIARFLGRSVSSIGREIKRNSSGNYGERFYEPLSAQNKAEERKRKAWEAKHPLKNSLIYEYVLGKLREGWSPEQISGRLKHGHPQDQGWWICQETIYRFIYHPNNQKQAWWEYLRRKQTRRRKKNGPKAQRIRIPERVSIHLRPKLVDKREEIGHWEGDTLVGLGRKTGLHTAYERLSSLIRMEKMSSLKAQDSIKAQMRVFQPLPGQGRKSTTLDNGSEHIYHTQLRKRLKMETYFVDPYSAWQRGGNENANLWIRYYFPKGTDFSKISEEDIRDVEWELNNRPRKRLGFKTPMEVFTQHLGLKGCTSC
jgi:IS30 family transposase